MPARSTCSTSWAQRSPGHRVWLRINPGFGHGHSNKTNTGGEHSKHGIWHTDLPQALAASRSTA
jgi:diaminopimelate decarboxylase